MSAATGTLTASTGLLLRQGEIQTDTWRLITDENLNTIPPGEKLILPLQRWLTEGNHESGVWLDSHETVEPLLDALTTIPVIALRFPLFTDGRAYSQARLLRQRYGYRGEIRAIGDVLRDQLAYMARCGFDVFALREDQEPQECLAALTEISIRYQE